jgi:hypothetical protein
MASAEPFGARVYQASQSTKRRMGAGNAGACTRPSTVLRFAPAPSRRAQTTPTVSRGPSGTRTTSPSARGSRSAGTA